MVADALVVLFMWVCPGGFLRIEVHLRVARDLGGYESYLLSRDLPGLLGAMNLDGGLVICW